MDGSCWEECFVIVFQNGSSVYTERKKMRFSTKNDGRCVSLPSGRWNRNRPLGTSPLRSWWFKLLKIICVSFKQLFILPLLLFLVHGSLFRVFCFHSFLFLVFPSKNSAPLMSLRMQLNHRLQLFFPKTLGPASFLEFSFPLFSTRLHANFVISPMSHSKPSTCRPSLGSYHFGNLSLLVLPITVATLLHPVAFVVRSS